MMRCCGHLEDTSSRECLAFRSIQLIAKAQVEGARDHCHRHLCGMPVSRDPVVGRELQAYGEGTRLVENTLNHGHARTRRQHRWSACPVEFGWRQALGLSRPGVAGHTALHHPTL